MKNMVHLALTALAASAAWAAVDDDAAGITGSAGSAPFNPSGYGLGSVIQSWRTPAGIDARACCEVGGYVIVNTPLNPQFVCTSTGSLVGSHSCPGYSWRDSSRCHLGTGYYAIINTRSPYTVAFIDYGAGSIVGSFTTQSMDPQPWNLAYDSDAGYYYANGYNENYFARKYTTAGSHVGSILIAGMGNYVGALGYTKAAKGRAGAYIFASNFGARTDAICTTTGSVVATWWAAGQNGCGGDCGKSSVNDDWVVWELRNPGLMVYEYDIEGNISVTPQSLGSIKALFK